MVDFIADMLDEWQATRDALRELSRREARFKYPDIIDKYGRRWWVSDGPTVAYRHDSMIFPATLFMDFKRRTFGPQSLPNVEAMYKGEHGLRDSHQWLGAVQPLLPDMPLKSGEHCHYCLVELGARDE